LYPENHRTYYIQQFYIDLPNSRKQHFYVYLVLTHFLEDGVDIHTVQELPEHSNIATTMVYPHVMKKPGTDAKNSPKSQAPGERS
jgi:hypothetical protein